VGNILIILAGISDTQASMDSKRDQAGIKDYQPDWWRIIAESECQQRPLQMRSMQGVKTPRILRAIDRCSEFKPYFA